MCQYCRTSEEHPAEKCHTLALLWDKDVAIVDGLESRCGPIPVKDSQLCKRRGCLKPHIKGGDKCAKHTRDVLAKRKQRSLRRQLYAKTA